MRTLEKILKHPFPRPEPEEVRGFSLDEILKTVTDNPRVINAASSTYAQEKFERILQSKTYAAELPNLLPYIEELCYEMLQRYPQHRILIAARDAELFYDALRTILENTPQGENVCLFPGSGRLMRYLAGQNIPCSWRERFLAAYGIDKESIRTTNFFLYDTGFRGTIGKLLEEAIRSEFRISNELNLVKIGLVCADTNDDYYHDLKELISFPYGVGSAKFPKTYRLCYFPSYGISKMNLLIAGALQVLPRYHGPFEFIDSLGRPKISPEKDFADDVDDSASFVNASVVNPVAAMLVQKRAVDYFQKRKEALTSLLHLS